MSTIIGIIVAFSFFDWPWRGVILAGFLLFDALEIYIWLRWRKKRSITGVEAIVGEHGRALTDCSTRGGQVWIKGQTWTARSAEGATAGENIEVIGVKGLTLHVRRA